MDLDCLLTNNSVISTTCTFFVKHPKLSFFDCYLATYASNAGTLPLFTFDEKLANQHLAAALVPVVTKSH